MSTMPTLPHHPESHTMRWTELELSAIRAYGEQCAAAEREACARVCDQWGAWNDTAQDIAAAIRSRKD